MLLKKLIIPPKIPRWGWPPTLGEKHQPLDFYILTQCGQTMARHMANAMINGSRMLQVVWKSLLQNFEISASIKLGMEICHKLNTAVIRDRWKCGECLESSISGCFRETTELVGATRE